MSIADYPPIDYIRQALRYDSGLLFWLERPRDHFASDQPWRAFNTRFAGKEAGTIRHSDGDSRCIIQFHRSGKSSIKLYRYRIVWALFENEWRLGIDHENRDSLDDRIGNLRRATQSQNLQNSTIRSNNTSGFKGVSWQKQANRWQVSIQVGNKSIHVGLFDDAEVASNAYLEAARKHFGEFATDGT